MPYSNKSKKLIKKFLGMYQYLCFPAQSYVVGMKVNEANFGWQGLATIDSNADHHEKNLILKIIHF